ncbi:GntR family transcriptional regulator [Amycolatopsis sp. CA-230715]|uniref:GntR family transcriptional regulator n=1 Tax=Amycolatopsis sp. CA-230715 TaxID=2745196 RepID=UPI001C010EA7|nr:GntR family transcriptional regulator [Amycolatopsis sp. CA-230715]QWF77596.1 HTH-type transcriptional repressor YvoA [Amycolatopsis sp. CA-230715]
MVDRRSGVPAFRQVAADLRDKISAGDYAPGDRLPSERELVESYGVSRPTIRDAVNVLRTEGIVTAEHGRGVFVRKSVALRRLPHSRLSRRARTRHQGAFLADAAAGGFTPTWSVTVRTEVAGERAASILEISADTEVTVRDRIMRADGLVVQLSTSRLPREFTRGTAIEEVDTGPDGTYARLEEAGHRLGAFAEHVGARMPSPAEASALQVDEGTPVLTVTRVAFRADGIPLEMNDIVRSADKYELSYEWAAD